jgi:hypothetical protein
MMGNAAFVAMIPLVLGCAVIEDGIFGLLRDCHGAVDVRGLEPDVMYISGCYRVMRTGHLVDGIRIRHDEC